MDKIIAFQTPEDIKAGLGAEHYVKTFENNELEITDDATEAEIYLEEDVDDAISHIGEANDDFKSGNPHSTPPPFPG